MAQTILELQLKGVDEAKASVQGLSEELVKQKDNQAKLKKEIKELEKTMKEEKGANDATIKSLAQKNIELEKSRKITRENTTALRQNIKVLDAQEGSLDQMRASLNLLQKEYAALDQTTQEGAMAADAMKQRIQALDTAVKAQEESIGDHRRSVGDYGKALQGLGQYFPILGANISATAPFLGDFGQKINKFAPLINVMGQNLGFAGGKMNEFVSSASEGPSILKQTQNAISKMPKGLKAMRAGFVAATSGIYGAVKASLAFLATPIGLALTAIVAAAGAAIYAFSSANKKAEREATAARKKFEEERYKIEQEFKAMNEVLAEALIISDAQLKVVKKGFSDAFADLNTLYEQAGKNGGKAYGDNFASTVEASVEASKKTTKQQFEAERAIIEEQLRLADENLLRFGAEQTARNLEQAENADASSRRIAENLRRQLRINYESYGQAEESFKTLTQQLEQLETQYKSDIAEAEALGKATIELSENFDDATLSAADLLAIEEKLEKEREARAEARRKQREEEREAEEKRKKMIAELLDKESERTLTEEQLIDKRFYDKLRELELDGDITKMTEKELELRTALYAKYNDDLKDLRDKNEADAEKTAQESFNKSLKLLQDNLAMDILVRETAMLENLRNEKLTEEQKLQLQKDFQDESLELQREGLVKQIQLIEGTLGEGETTAELEQLRNALAKLGLEIQDLGKDEEGKTLADILGLDDEDDLEKISQGIAGIEAGLGAMSDLAQAKAQERLSRVDQMLQQGVINEEEATRKKEQIQKEAARKQQKIDVVQAVINTAKAVTAGLASTPFLPVGLIMGGIAAAQGAAQIKMIRSQKFAQGGILNGPSHAQGGIPMFSKGGAFYGEAEGGEAVLTKGVMANPALASMASALNVAGGGVPFFANGGVLDPIQSATPTDRAADIIASGLKSRQPVLVVEQLRERENSVDVIESLRTIG